MSDGIRGGHGTLTPQPAALGSASGRPGAVLGLGYRAGGALGLSHPPAGGEKRGAPPRVFWSSLFTNWAVQTSARARGAAGVSW